MRLPLALPDLRSRLGQCARIVLSPLDDAGRRDASCASVRSVADWNWTRPRWIGCCGASAATCAGLTALLDRLDRASLAAQRRMTVPFLRETLGPMRR